MDNFPTTDGGVLTDEMAGADVMLVHLILTDDGSTLQRKLQLSQMSIQDQLQKWMQYDAINIIQ